MIYKRIYIILIIIIVMFIAQNLIAQIILQGTITDNGGEFLGNGAEPVAKAFITVINEMDSTLMFSTYSNEQGHYSINISQTAAHENHYKTLKDFRLFQNFPNPFNPSTVIGYQLARPAYIRIEIYNVLGKKIRTLLNEYQKAGSGQVIWDGTNDLSQGVSAGVYIYCLKVEDQIINQKMLLIDGRHCYAQTLLYHENRTEFADRKKIHKPMTNTYSVKVRGESIKTYIQQNIRIISNIILDLTVKRTVTDIDGNVYQTVKIGDQWWMAENLKVSHYRNGDAVSQVTDDMKWGNLQKGAFCYYNNDSSIVLTDGLLYNWYAVNDSRNISPQGWHVPTDREWKELEMALGMDELTVTQTSWRGKDEGDKLKTINRWDSDGNGSNISGFFALPAGCRIYQGSFNYLNKSAYFWTSTKGGDTIIKAWGRHLKYNKSGIYRIGHFKKRYGFSVRLVRDD